ncbi:MULTISPECIES: hypothetical protein [unclassified Haematospirillum]|uniref:hypothetical protein n=1 Tax=unclassified Haematospirillum TaxID=2622088 RepID=UPI00143C2ABC|nr:MULTISPECIES: hypothetical protein [unclassified Haematospirillum]NKD54145.1 hypothetical protein [Haematospirillum sp. H4890]NKD74190.1 hypothetical protein [Haematospirillum sp. H4485]NKD87141.1 hypothetical protein [Haematospirillum sp. 15-248]
MFSSDEKQTCPREGWNAETDHGDLLKLVSQLDDALGRSDTARFTHPSESIVDRLISHMREEGSALLYQSYQAAREYQKINRAIELQGLTILSILERNTLPGVLRQCADGFRNIIEKEISVSKPLHKEVEPKQVAMPRKFLTRKNLKANYVPCVLFYIIQKTVGREQRGTYFISWCDLFCHHLVFAREWLGFGSQIRCEHSHC